MTTTGTCHASTPNATCGYVRRRTLTRSAWSIVAAAMLVAAISCGGTLRGTPNPTRRLVNLRAFARLYGVIRWFHPSDAAAAVDWDRVAGDGVRQVLDAVDSHALRAQLATLFEPIAPTMHIVSAGEAFP